MGKQKRLKYVMRKKEKLEKVLNLDNDKSL